MISGVRNVSTLDRGRDKILGPEQQPGVESVAGGGAPEDPGLPLPTVRWAEMAHRPCGLAAVGPGCDTADLPDEDRGRSRGCARPWPDDAGCRAAAAAAAVAVAVGTVLRAGSTG